MLRQCAALHSFAPMSSLHIVRDGTVAYLHYLNQGGPWPKLVSQTINYLVTMQHKWRYYTVHPRLCDQLIISQHFNLTIMRSINLHVRMISISCPLHLMIWNMCGFLIRETIGNRGMATGQVWPYIAPPLLQYLLVLIWITKKCSLQLSGCKVVHVCNPHLCLQRDLSESCSVCVTGDGSCGGRRGCWVHDCMCVRDGKTKRRKLGFFLLSFVCFLPSPPCKRV